MPETEPQDRRAPGRMARHVVYASLLVAALCGVIPSAHADPRWRDEWPRTDFTRRTVKLEEIDSGGPPKNGIPAIDQPRFIGADAAAQWLAPDEPVIVFERRGEARAYPLQIMIFHEIVNDTVAGTPVMVTFCPLCNASLVFDRRVNGVTLDFGTTGKLRKSDLIMYDRQTESWWQQFSGKGIVGSHAGDVLHSLHSVTASFEDFRRAYPQGRVLSRDTGYSKPYGRNPYSGYDRIGSHPFLFRGPVDPRLPAMERVLGVTQGGKTRIYPLSRLPSEPVINDELGGEPLVILSREGMRSALDTDIIRESNRIDAVAAYSRRAGNRVLTFERRGDRIVDRETRSEWNLFGSAVTGPLAGTRLTSVDGGVHFAFAWLAFNPQSEIYAPPGAARK